MSAKVLATITILSLLTILAVHYAPDIASLRKAIRPDYQAYSEVPVEHYKKELP